MKANLFQDNNILKFISLRFISALLCLFLFAGINAGNKSGKRDMKSIKVQLERAEANYQKNLNKKLFADSLLNLGLNIHETSSDEIRATIIQMNDKSRSFTTLMKKLKKDLKSNTPKEVNDARASIKNLENDYSQALANFDLIMKDQINLSDDGTKYLFRGEAFKREIRKSFKASQKKLIEAQSAMGEQAMLTSNK